MFFFVLSLVLSLAHVFVAASLSFLLSGGAGRGGIFLLFALLLVFTLTAFPFLRSLPPLLSWVFYCWLGLLLLLTVCCAVADLAAWLGSALPFDPAKRQLVRSTLGFGAVAGAGVLAAQAYRTASLPPPVREVSVLLENWADGLNGLRVVQLSDLHIGAPQDKAWLEDLVTRTMALAPDLIVLTGDLVDGAVSVLAQEVAPLSHLRAPLGVYFVTGNHEFYSGANEWCAFLATLGITPLRNAHVTLRRGGAAFDLAGTEDARAGAFGAPPDLDKALAGRDPSLPVILLAHQPIAIFEAAARGVDLQLSGHTHGGQIWPFGWLVRLQQPYLAGLARHEGTKTQIYVSRGAGLWGPPLRLGAPAEITLLTLGRAATPRKA